MCVCVCVWLLSITTIDSLIYTMVSEPYYGIDLHYQISVIHSIIRSNPNHPLKNSNPKPPPSTLPAIVASISIATIAVAPFSSRCRCYCRLKVPPASLKSTPIGTVKDFANFTITSYSP